MRCHYQGNMCCFLHNYDYLYNHQIPCIIFTRSKQERDFFVWVCMHNTFRCPGTPRRKWIGTSSKSQSSCLLVFWRVRRENSPGCELIGYSFYYSILLLLIDNSCVKVVWQPLLEWNGFKWIECTGSQKEAVMASREKSHPSRFLQVELVSCSALHGISGCSCVMPVQVFLHLILYTA